MDLERLERLDKIEKSARSAVGALGLAGRIGNRETRARAVAAVEGELARAFPGEDPELLRHVAEAQFARKRRRRTARPSSQGSLLIFASGFVALLALFLLYTQC